MDKLQFLVLILIMPPKLSMIYAFAKCSEFLLSNDLIADLVNGKFVNGHTVINEIYRQLHKNA